MNLTLFTVEEANQLLGEIRSGLEQLVRAKQELDRLRKHVDVLSLAASGATPGNPDAEALRQWVQRRNTLSDRIRQGVQSIQARGVMVKDLDRGLVDFYSVSGDRLIFLCWQLGEAEVSHWHTIEGGFSSRQPLHRSERE